MRNRAISSLLRTTEISSSYGDESAFCYIDRICRRIVFRGLHKLQHGQLTISDALGCHTFGLDHHEVAGSRLSLSTIKVKITVDNPKFYRLLLANGSIGFGEGFFMRYWCTDELVLLLRLLSRNLTVLSTVSKGMGGFAWLKGALRKYLLDKNTKLGSKRNIEKHYDLSNDFFALFLDPTMSYSSARFDREEGGLEQASLAKMDEICRSLELKQGDHLLEIGTGWGGFAIHAARNYGCKVTTTTISTRQYEYAVRKVEESGLRDRITLLLEDYRQIPNQCEGKVFDKVVSIEMIEAVGHKNIESYLALCSRLMKSDGLMLIQSITIDDQRHEKALKTVDYIQRYIFPGGSLPCVSSLATMVKNSTEMRMLKVDDLTQDYAVTLAHWRESFDQQHLPIKELGFDQEFIRKWQYYFNYCEAGFREKVIGCKHFLLANPQYRGHL
ncbi:MAG: cyclopropane-fatty-acyl-phospholipid synthase family protein [Sedimenticola sp.]